MQHRTLNRLAGVFHGVAEAEQKTEVIRQVLAEQRHFEPQSAFRRLDRTRSGQLTASNIVDFLEVNKIVVTHKEAVQLLKRLDLNGDGRVTYSDFAESILPQEDSRLKQIANLREGYHLEEGEPLPYEAEWSLARALEQEVKNYRNIESLKEILVSSVDFNKLDCFNAVDEQRQGSLSIPTQQVTSSFLNLNRLLLTSVDDFIRNQGKVLSEDQLHALFRRVGGVNVISYPQFVEMLTPVETTPGGKGSTQSRLNSTFSKTFRQSDGLKSFNGGASRSRLAEEAEKDNEYQEYLTRSGSQERSRGSQGSPNRRTGQMSQSKLETNQRSPYHSPGKAFHLGSTLTGQSRLPVTKQNAKTAVKSPMRGNEEEHLVRALKEQIVIDRDMEELKNQLAFRHDFNSEDAFRVFDKKGRGYLTKFELEQALNDIGNYPTKDELHLFFKRYDRDNDGLLKFSDFSEMVTPTNIDYAALSKSRQPSYLSPDDGLGNLSLDTRRIYKKLLSKAFQAEVEVEYIRQKLSRRPLFSLYDAFLAIDNLDNGFLNMNAFRDILQEYGVFISQNDLNTLIKRYDKNQDNRVTFPEFMNELTPKSPVQQL